MKNTNIIIAGFGSIGQRHYKNLKTLGYKNLWVYDPYISQPGREVKLLKKLDEKELKSFDIAFICNPNQLHVEAALACAKAGCHLFIEKPLSHKLENVEKLAKICQKNKLVNMVACNMRFHPALKFIKKYLEDGKIGKIHSLQLQTGYFLPFWRPNSDYRKNYAAKKKTGGGIILDGIHNFDLLFWLNDFNRVKKSSLVYDRVGSLEIETEDNFVAGFVFQNKVMGSVIGDYLQKAYSWTAKVVGEKGNLAWDFKENIVWLADEKGKNKLWSIKNYDPNKMYAEETKYFLDCVRSRKKTFNDITRAADVLKYCLK
ncbi:MAG: Gfo/Idh/MocA family oxidoreductase [Patescibacteria group bacterium]|jgi:predicted dehydrogenase